jgi:hypothetical protein
MLQHCIQQCNRCLCKCLFLKFTMPGGMGATGWTRKGKGETKGGLPIRPLGTDHKGEWALWQLSLVLAEIASQDRLEPSVDFQDDGETRSQGQEMVRNRAKPALEIANRIHRERSGSKGGRKKTRTP